MSNVAKRGVAAALTVVVSAATGLITNIATEEAAWGWWTALLVLVVLGAALQYHLSRSSALESSAVSALGDGSIAVGGTARAPIKTQVRRGATPSTAAVQPQGTAAVAPGSVAIGGDAESSVETEVDNGT